MKIVKKINVFFLMFLKKRMRQGRIQDFKLGGAHLKKLHRAKGGAKIVGVFRVKNHDFTPKNHIISNFREGARRVQRALLWIRPCEGTPIESPIFVSY